MLENAALALTATPWVYVVLFALAVVDGFFPPVPSETVLIALAATSVALGTPNLALVLVAGAAGAFVGDQVAYWIGSRVNVRRVRFLQGRTAQRTLDAASRTLLVEVQLPSQGTLLAGMYAQVTLDLSEPRPVLRLPATALQLGAHGPRVALVDEKHKLHFQPVQVGEDHGTEVEIVNGLSVEDQVVLFVPAGVSDDTQVEVMEPKRT